MSVIILKDSLNWFAEVVCTLLNNILIDVLFLKAILIAFIPQGELSLALLVLNLIDILDLCIIFVINFVSVTKGVLSKIL